MIVTIVLLIVTFLSSAITPTPQTINAYAGATLNISPTPVFQPTQIPTAQPTPSLTPTTKPTRQPTKTPIPTSHINTTDNTLAAAINNFRKDHGISAISRHETLCSITNTRLQQLVKRGELDNHDGIFAFQPQIFQTFSEWWEVLFFASPEKNSRDVVYQGWAQSPSHKDSILKNEATHGCGAEQGGYAVFLLARKK